jgi:hypothetical protein
MSVVERASLSVSPMACQASESKDVMFIKTGGVSKAF